MGIEGIKLGHPQTRKTGSKTARDQEPPGDAVPAGPSAAKSGGELEGAQDAEQQGIDDMDHHGQRYCNEPRIFWRDLRAAGQPGQADGASEERDKAERDQRGGHQPIGPGGVGSPRTKGLLKNNFPICLPPPILWSAVGVQCVQIVAPCDKGCAYGLP